MTLAQLNPDAAALVEIAAQFCGPNHDSDTLAERLDKVQLWVDAVYGCAVDADSWRVARWTLAGEPLTGAEYERCVDGVSAFA